MLSVLPTPWYRSSVKNKMRGAAESVFCWTQELSNSRKTANVHSPRDSPPHSASCSRAPLPTTPGAHCDLTSTSSEIHRASSRTSLLADRHTHKSYTLKRAALEGYRAGTHRTAAQHGRHAPARSAPRAPSTPRASFLALLPRCAVRPNQAHPTRATCLLLSRLAAVGRWASLPPQPLSPSLPMPCDRTQVPPSASLSLNLLSRTSPYISSAAGFRPPAWVSTAGSATRAESPRARRRPRRPRPPPPPWGRTRRWTWASTRR